MTFVNHYVTDLHIHIGRTRSNAAVKITAASSLTLENIIYYAEHVKGIDVIGVIDSHVSEILDQIEEQILSGEAYERADGGIQFSNVTLLLGTEIEIYDENCHGPIHVIAYLPTLEKMRTFSNWLSKRMKNATLSSQRIYEKAVTLQETVQELQGLFVPAHIFTPFKSLYGKGVKSSLTEVFKPSLIDAVELGLSSDTAMAEQVTELQSYPFLTNSDAHSLEKMAREYQIIQMKEPSFSELRLALKEVDGRKIVANYGLDPLLGKYYQTICANCLQPMTGRRCLICHSESIIKGVSERIKELSLGQSKVSRPSYVHQIPLEFIPKVGRKTLNRLRAAFGTDMNVIHNASRKELEQVVSPKIVDSIIQARTSDLVIRAGGGGRFGKIIE